jgi:hypothetical protein
MLGALICCWVQLAGVLGGEKTYSGSSIIIKIYPALSLAIGGRDGMDGSGGHWMTCSNYRRDRQSWLYGRFLAVGCIWRGFRAGYGYYINKIIHLGCFWVHARGQDEVGERLATRSRSRAFPIREAVPVGLGF